MVTGITGDHGEVVQKHAMKELEQDTEAVLTLLRQMEAKHVQEATQKQDFVLLRNAIRVSRKLKYSYENAIRRVIWHH